MPKVSLSKSALVLSPCLAWADPTALWYDEALADTTDRDRGTAYHGFIEEYVSGKTPAPPHEDKEMVDWVFHGMHYVDVVLAPQTDSLQGEVCVGINWSTGEALVFPGVKDRAYPDKPGFMFGTADIVAVMKNGRLFVGDWKTGGSGGAYEQLMSLACGFQKCMPDEFGKPRQVTIACLSVREDGVHPEEWNPTQEELDAHWDSMRFQSELFGKGSPHVPGIHCTQLYCPHLAYCKAITDVVISAAEEDRNKKGLPMLKHYRMTDSPMSNEEAGYVMERISAARRQMKYYESALKEYIKNGGRVQSGSWEWRETGAGFRWTRKH